MSEIKAIETVYNGYKFRSRLEARWAVFFDAAGIKYEYEPQGFELSDGTKYLPDFYLPEMHQFFECKGVMSGKDQHKIDQFISDSNIPVVIGYDNLEFSACDDWWGSGFTSAEKIDSRLAMCMKCNKLFFVGMNGSYACPLCKHYDGDTTFYTVLSGTYDELGRYDLEPARTKAKQARFEHGETPNGNGNSNIEKYNIAMRNFIRKHPSVSPFSKYLKFVGTKRIFVIIEVSEEARNPNLIIKLLEGFKDDLSQALSKEFMHYKQPEFVEHKMVDSVRKQLRM